MTNIDSVLDILLAACPDMIGVSFAGWKEFTGEQLVYVAQEFKSLQRIDLSSVNVSHMRIKWAPSVLTNNIPPPHFQLELNPQKSAVGFQSLCNAIQALGSRLTHLTLAHNRLAGIPQIITALSVSIASQISQCQSPTTGLQSIHRRTAPI